MWSVWKVYYMTYPEIAATGIPEEKCFPPELVAKGLKFDAAMSMMNKLGFGYCVKPWEIR
jgi:hypothetical protein